MTTSRKQLERRPLFPGHRPERGLLGEIDRHGNEVWYYRDGHGPRTRILGEFGSAAFIEAYKAAKWGRPAADAPKKGQSLSRQDPNSLQWLIDRYLGWLDRQMKADATKKQHRNILKRVGEKNGDKPYRLIDWSNVKALRDHVAQNGLDPEKPGAAPAMANRVVSTIRSMYDWAIAEEKLVERNPCAEVTKVAYKAESHHPWTDAECDAFEAAYPLGARERLMYELLQTGQRCSDVVRMGPQHIDRDGDGMTIVQQKTGKEVTVPMLRHLKEALAAGPCGKETFIASEHDGSAISAGHFGNVMRAACDKIGVAECTAHGLRHAAATRALENGADADYLMAVFGFTLPIAAKYVATFKGKRAAKRGAHFGERKPKLKLVKAA
jgi:integrase